MNQLISATERRHPRPRFQRPSRWNPSVLGLCVAIVLFGIGSSDEERTDAAVAAAGAAAASRLAYVGRVADGDLDSRGEPVAVRGSGDLAMDAGGRALYLVTEHGLEVFARDARTGRLDRVQSVAQGIDLSRAALAWDAGRGRLLADDCGAWRAFPLLRGGADSGRLAEGVELTAEDDPYTCGDALLLQADGAFAYRIGPGRVDVFETGPAGALRFVQTLEAPGLSSAALDGDRLYALADDGLLVFARDAVTGLMATASDPVPLVGPGTALAVAAPARAYVVEADGVGVFDLATPSQPRRAATPFPDSRDRGGCRFAAAVSGADAVDVFCRRGAFGARWSRGAADAETWTAGVAAEMPAYGPPVAIAASPDGRHVYVATPASGLLVFARGGASQGAAPTTMPSSHAGPEAHGRAAVYLPPVPGARSGGRYAPFNETGPDLLVDAPTIVRTSFAGRQFKVRVKVRNEAGAMDGQATLTFRRSTDDAAISASDDVVGGKKKVSEVDSTGQQRESDPQDPDSGAYYGACVEAVANELDTTNNCSTAEFVAVGAPDLVVAVATVSDPQLRAGAKFELTATVSNAGVGRSPAAYLIYYSSEDAAIGTDDKELGRFEVGLLEPGASVAETIEAAVLASPGSRHYYGACVVPWELGVESDAGNNCSAAAPVNASEFSRMIDLGDIGAAYGIAHWNGQLYVVDNDADHVRAYDRDGARDTGSEFALADGNGNTNGMAYANDRFYLLDSADDKVYAYHTDGTRDVDADFELAKGNPDDADNNLVASGIVHVDNRFLVVDYEDRKVYAYTAKGSQDTDAGFLLAAAAPSEPTGIAYASDGRLYVLGDGKAFAYLPKGQREPASDLVLDGENGDASGITYGNAFYVLDRTDQQVYVYHMPTEPVGATQATGGFRLGTGTYLGIVYSGNGFYAIRTGSKVEAYAADGKRLADLDFDLDEINASPWGITHADGVFYVVDYHGKKVYAYAAGGLRLTDRDFNLEDGNGNPVGIVYADGAFYVFNHSGGKVYAYGADRTRRADLDFDLDQDNRSPSDIVHADGAFYVVDFYGKKVYAYGADRARRADLDFDLDGDHNDPGGIAHADGTFYVVGYDGSDPEPGDKVYAYGAGTTVRGDFDLDGDHGDPSFIAHTDDAFYVVDFYGKKVYAYATDGARSANQDFPLDGSNDVPMGIAHAGGAFYVVDFDDKMVYAYAADGKRSADRDFHLDARNSRPAGIAHAGGEFYVVDGYDDTVYAYATDGTRSAERDFYLDGDNDGPLGIAYADSAFYVVDYYGRKVYAYAADGKRHAELDFDLYPRNGVAVGSTAHDGTLYVVDNADARVYAYPNVRPSNVASAPPPIPTHQSVARDP